MKKLLFILLIAYCSLLTVNCKGQTWVAIPDANFVTQLQSIVPSAMSGNQLNISSPLVTTTTQTINVNGHLISNLSGIQYFTSLTYLNCGNNSLSSLPSLPNSLIYLDCSSETFGFSATFSSLPTLPTSLQFLYCQDNIVLTSLPTLPNSIKILWCSDNNLTSLPALPTSLTQLYCVYTYITTLPTLPNSLTWLECSNNRLTSLPTLPNSLTWLNCGSNNLTTLPVLPDSMSSLSCFGNNISCFPTFPRTIILANNFSIDPNPYNCLPNYISAMLASNSSNSVVSDSVLYPICAAGNTNGCAVAGIEQYNINNQVMVWPNPANTILNIAIDPSLTLPEGERTIVVTDVLGNVLMQQSYSSPSGRSGGVIDVSSLMPGVYNLCISTPQGTANKRIVIER